MVRARGQVLLPVLNRSDCGSSLFSAVGPRSSVQTGRVFISMLQAHGIMQNTFGMATGGPLPELMS